MKLFRGWIGEKKAAFFLWLSLSKKKYRTFHNVILPSKNGTTQIDHLIISVFGLFIVETKNKKGWIFGHANQPYWTQLIYGQKYSFQNPLRQVYRQKKVLSEFLNLEETRIHTVVCFVGDCSFKTDVPGNVIYSGVGGYIKQFRNEILSFEEVDRIAGTISRHLSESSLSKRDHLNSLRERHSSHVICPRCGANLVERTAKWGSRPGSKFLGCEKYPICHFTRNVLPEDLK